MEQRETSSRQDTHFREKEAEPEFFDVFTINDDFTDLWFVVSVLQEVFFLSHQKANDAAWATHRKGKAKVGTYPYDIAVSKVRKAEAKARQKEYPLRFEIKTAEEKKQ